MDDDDTPERWCPVCRLYPDDCTCPGCPDCGHDPCTCDEEEDYR